MSDLNRFRSTLSEWLARNGLDYDVTFYSPEQWRQRREDVLEGAELVIVTEGGLSALLEYNFAHPKVDELQDLCESFGFWFEIGHVWSIGFYRQDEGSVRPASGATYQEKLQDPRWLKKAALVKERAGYRCEDCGVQTLSVEAHHCWYRYGLEPWQYPLDALRCLCRTCHETRAPAEHRWRTFPARLTGEEIDTVRTALKELFYWYDRKAALSFLKTIGFDDEAMTQALGALIVRKTEPGAD